MNVYRISGRHHESGTVKRNKPDRSQRPRCVYYYQRNLEPTEHSVSRGINISGVDFWHAVEFSRNGRFLRTHPRYSLRLSSGQFPFGSCCFVCLAVLRFRLYQTVSVSDFLGAFQVSAFAFPFPASPTLSDPFGPDSQSDGLVFPAVGPFRRVRL